MLLFSVESTSYLLVVGPSGLWLRQWRLGGIVGPWLL
jgi:hypothetical protein